MNNSINYSNYTINDIGNLTYHPIDCTLSFNCSNFNDFYLLYQQCWNLLMPEYNIVIISCIIIEIMIILMIRDFRKNPL